jgi:hypothetical protein
MLVEKKFLISYKQNKMFGKKFKYGILDEMRLVGKYIESYVEAKNQILYIGQY